MNYHKVIMGICYSVIIYLCTFNGVLSQNIIKNPGFETGVISPLWGIWPEGSSVVTIDTNIVGVGEFSAKLTGVEAYLYQSVSLEPNTTYNISATLKAESGNAVYFGVRNIWNTIGVSLIFNETIFQTKSMSFTTDNNPYNDPQVYIWKEDGTGSVWVDDFLLIADTIGRIPDEMGGLGTYYVSPMGNDLNNGTSPGQAWKTIDKINQINFEPGDKILFEGGKTFYGGIRFNHTDSGTINAKICLGSYGSGKATIDAGTGSGFIASDCKNLNIKNLNFKGDGRKTGNTGNGISFSFCSDIQVDSVEIFGFQHSGLTVKNAGKDYRLTNINSHDNGYAGIYIAGIDKISLSDIYIGHCNVNNNPGDPTKTNNHSGNGIFAYNAKNIIVEYCSASNNGWDMPRIGNGPGGIWVAEVDNAIIQYCISYDNKTSVGGQDGLGFDLDGGTTNSIIQYCLSYNNQGAGYGIFQYNGATEWNNNTIRYCISENDGNISEEGNILIWNGSRNKTEFQGLEFYNNVIYNSSKTAINFYDHFNSNFNFRNNIFVSKTSSIYNRINGENFQGNCWYTLNNNFYLDSLNFISWAQTANQEILNGEIIGKYANPMLNNPGNSTVVDPLKLMEIDDYKVNEGSIVIDAGLDLKSLFNIDPGNHDYYGNPIKQGLSFDMGVHEYKELLQQHEMSFTPGWNIFSVPNNPDTSDMTVIFQPVIDRGSLVKIQDQLGNSLENWGIFGGWQNNIGEIDPSEGYKVKLNSNDSLKVFGTPVKYPFPILLKNGWNIAGYPHQTDYNGMNILQQLLDRGVLEKAQDENGNSIEDWGIFGGWQNNIGNFAAGKGYKIKVNLDDTLWIYESYPKSSTIQPELIATTHFTPAFEGNGIDHMNINLVGLPVNILNAGDQLAIFDGETCVGAVMLMSHHINNQSVSIVASATDNQGMAGFTEGNQFTLKLWNSRNNQEFTIEPEIVKGTSTFTKHETTIASLEKYVTTGLEKTPDTDLNEINCYPNPFSDKVTIEINLATDAQVQVEVLNQLGQKVKTIVSKKQLTNGQNKLSWDGRNASNVKVAPGIYHLRIEINGEINFKKVVFSKTE